MSNNSELKIDHIIMMFISKISSFIFLMFGTWQGVVGERWSQGTFFLVTSIILDKIADHYEVRFSLKR